MDTNISINQLRKMIYREKDINDIICKVENLKINIQWNINY